VKIVLGAPHYPPRFFAGVEKYTRQLANSLTGRGHSVEVVCVDRIDSSHHAEVQTEYLDGIPIRRLGLSLAGRGLHLGQLHADDALESWFRNYLAETRPDVFHFQGGYLLTASPLDAAADLGVPTLLTLHDHWFFCSRINLLRPDGRRCDARVTPARCAWCLMTEHRRHRYLNSALSRLGPRPLAPAMAKALSRLVDPRLLAAEERRAEHLSRTLLRVQSIVTLGRLSESVIGSRGLGHAPIRRMFYGLSARNRPRPRDEFFGDGLRIAYLGQIAPHKGAHLLVEAFTRLEARGRRLTLGLHGSTEQFPAYVLHLRKLIGGDQRVTFHGPFAGPSLDRILENVDIVVVPSLCFETGPLVVLEAFAARVPVVAVRLPNTQDRVRDGVDGLLFAPGDSRDLGRCLQRLIDEPGLLNRLASGISPVNTVDEEVDDLIVHYRDFVP
jgi:glycosyltransferase involved in cell wall biosynthesis